MADTLQDIIDFLTFLNSIPFDFHDSLEKSRLSLESYNLSKKSKSIKHIINVIFDFVTNHLSVFAQFNQTAKKLTSTREKIFKLYEETKDQEIKDAFNYFSLACFHFFQLQEATTPVSRSLLNFVFLLKSISIHIRTNSLNLEPEEQESALKWGDFLLESYTIFVQYIQYYNTNGNSNDNIANQEHSDVNKNNKDNYLLSLQEFSTQFTNICDHRKILGIDELALEAKNTLVDILDLINPPPIEPETQPFLVDTKKAQSTFSFAAKSKANEEPFHLYTNNMNYPKKRTPRRKLASSHSMEHLSLSNVQSATLNTSYGFRITKRKPILIDPTSPIKRKPSGRHISFNFLDPLSAPSKPLISPNPKKVDPALLLPFIENPPFVGWNITYLREKISFQLPPTINYNPSEPKFAYKFENFHLLPIKDASEMTDEELSQMVSTNSPKIQTKKSSVHFRKKEKKKEKRQSSVRLSSKKHVKKTEMDVESAGMMKEINMVLRHCAKKLKNSKTCNDQFERLQIVIEWFKMIYMCLPNLVKCSKSFPKNEFVVDAIREYEHIRIEFDEILDKIEYINGQTFRDSIVQCSKQLSLILASLDIYSNNEDVTSNQHLSLATSKVMIYLSDLLHSLMIIVDCVEPVAFISCSDFFTNLKHAIVVFQPIFDDLESIVQKTILLFATNALIATLNPFTTVLEKFEPVKINTISEDEIQQQVTNLREITEDLLNRVKGNQKLVISMASNLIMKCLNDSDHLSPLFIRDINELANVVESSIVELADHEPEDKDRAINVFIAMRRLQCDLLVKLGNEACTKEKELDRLVARNEADFNELANQIQRSAATVNSDSLNALSIHWIDSIHRIILGFADLMAVSPILVMLPYLYEQIAQYFGKLQKTVQFFLNPNKAVAVICVDLSSILRQLLNNLENTQDYVRIQPFTYYAEEYEEHPLFRPIFDFDKYKCGFSFSEKAVFSSSSSFSMTNSSSNSSLNSSSSKKSGEGKFACLLKCMRNQLQKPFRPMYALKYLHQLISEEMQAVASIGDDLQKEKNIAKKIGSLTESLNAIVPASAGQQETTLRCYTCKGENSLIVLLVMGDFVAMFVEIATKYCNEMKDKVSFHDFKRSFRTVTKRLKETPMKKKVKRLTKAFRTFKKSEIENLQDLFIKASPLFARLLKIVKEINLDESIVNNDDDSSSNASQEDNNDICGMFNPIISLFDYINETAEEEDDEQKEQQKIEEEEEEEENEEEEEENENDENENNDNKEKKKRKKKKGVTSEDIFRLSPQIREVLENSASKSSRLLMRIAYKIKAFDEKAKSMYFTKYLSRQLVVNFVDLVKGVRTKYAMRLKEIVDESNFYIVERIESIAKSLYQRDMIVATDDPEFLLAILSKKMAEADHLVLASEDYNFVVKTIINLGITVLNAGVDHIGSIDTLRQFVASFDYLTELAQRERNNSILSDQMMRVIDEFSKIPMDFPGCYASKICLHFLLIEADTD